MNNILKTNNMLLQNRTPLPPGFILTLGSIKYKIVRVTGFGSATIVYEATYKDSLIEDSIHLVYIKELYPYLHHSLIDRKEDGSLRWDAKINSFMEDQRSFFKKGVEINLSLLENLPAEISGNLNSYEDHGTYYTILPIHGGEFLNDLIQNKKLLELKKCIEIMKGCLDSVKRFHENNLLIMDISPDNMLVLPHQVMFIDYNSIWNCMNEGDEFIFSEKEGYTAPEVLFYDIDQIGPWTDLYSAASVFYEMITGKILQPNDLGRLPEIIQESPLLPVDSRDIFQKLLDIFRKGLDPLTRRRYQSCAEFLWDLEQLKDLLEQSETPNVKKTIPDEKRSTRIPMILSICLAFLLIFLGGIIYKGYQNNKIESHILYQGSSNSNLLNRGRLCVLENEYLYYVDMDGNLRVNNYNAKTGEFKLSSLSYDNDKKTENFPNDIIDNDLILFATNPDISDDMVVFLNLGRDIEGNANKIYFLYAGGMGHSDSLMSMNLDGSNQEILLTFGENEQGDQFTYAMQEDGCEYIYYLMAAIPEDINGLRSYQLCRFDLDTQQNDVLLNESVEWFNLYDQYLYYIIYDDNLGTSVLKRSSLEGDLDGEESVILDETSEYWDGFIEDDTLFLFSFAEDLNSLIVCDLDSNIKGSIENPYLREFDTLNYDFLYEDKWIYYIDRDHKQMRRFNISMTSDQLVVDEIDCVHMNCASPFVVLYLGK